MISTIQKHKEMDEAVQSMRSLLVFQLAGQAFALNIESVVQIIPMLRLTAVPQVDHMIEGVANIRGKIIPVISARSHLGMPLTRPGLYTPIILAKAGERQLGVIVDQVTDVISVPEEEIISPGSILPDGMENSPVMSGLVYQQDISILVLDPRYLLRPSQFRSIHQAVNAAPARVYEPCEEESHAVDSVVPERRAFEAVRAALAEKRIEVQPGSHTPASKPAPVEPTSPSVQPALADVLLPAVSPQPPVATEPPAESIQNGKKGKNSRNGKRGKSKGNIIPATAVNGPAQITSRTQKIDSILADQFAALSKEIQDTDGSPSRSADQH